jgi:hypothetical protein
MMNHNALPDHVLQTKIIDKLLLFRGLLPRIVHVLIIIIKYLFYGKIHFKYVVDSSSFYTAFHVSFKDVSSQ